MISIETHCASIGIFYNKSKLLTNVEQNGCYCKIYETYFADYNLAVFCRFYKYFSECYKQIFVEIESSDYTPYKITFYEYLVYCYDQILEVN